MMPGDSNATVSGAFLTRSIMLWICCLLMVLPASAQHILSTGGAPALAFGRPETTVQFQFQGSDLTSSTNKVAEFTSHQKRYNEQIGIRGDFHLFDPSFLNINYGVLLSFLQEGLDSVGKKSPAAGRVFGYDMGGTLFSQKSYATNFFANRAHTFNLREFAGTSEFLSKNEGASLSLRSAMFPSTLSYRNELAKEASRFGFQQARREEQRTVLAYDGARHINSQDVSAHYDISKQHDLLGFSPNFRTQNLSLNDRWDFTEERNKSLNSNVYYVGRKDGEQVLASSSLILTEDLNLHHTDSFSSNYQYNLERLTAATTKTMVQTGLGRLTYQLYKTLTAVVTARGSHAGVAGGSQNAYGAAVDTGYRKKLPGNGALLATAGGSYNVHEQQLRNATLPVFREKHAAQIGIPFRLSQPQVVETTISVSAESGAILLMQGVDYEVRLIGQFVEITVLPLGKIREGEELLIDYEVRSPQSLAFSNRVFNWTISPDFGWVNPYYTFENNAQTALSGTDGDSLDTLIGRTAGIRFRLIRQRVALTSGNEYHTQQSRILPYDSLQFIQSASVAVLRSISVGVTFDENLFHYSKPERRTRSGAGRFNIRWQPVPAISAEVFVTRRIWRDSLDIGEDLREEGMRAQWTLRTFALSFSISHDQRIRSITRSEQLGWLAGIVRKF